MPELNQNPIAAPNYQLIAQHYDRRYLQMDSGDLQPVVQRHMGQVKAGVWLEVGCGTGQWLQAPPSHLSVVGLDQSRAMLAQAAQKLHGTPLVQAAAGTLPISMNCCSGIAAVHALHHFPDQDRFLHQAYRCLVEGGGLLVVGMNAHAEDIDWYIYDFFEGTAERDRARFLSYSELSTRLQELGFRRVERGLAKLIDDVQIGAAVLEQPFLQRRGCSQLALLSDEEYERGLLRVRAAIKDEASFKFRIFVRLEYLWALK